MNQWRVPRGDHFQKQMPIFCAGQGLTSISDLRLDVVFTGKDSTIQRKTLAFELLRAAVFCLITAGPISHNRPKNPIKRRKAFDLPKTGSSLRILSLSGSAVLEPAATMWPS